MGFSLSKEFPRVTKVSFVGFLVPWFDLKARFFVLRPGLRIADLFA
jgi:hypothetical protein